MNRWLKYSGIMPEWISSAAFRVVNGSFYTTAGGITQSEAYRRTTNFYTLYPGKYNAKFIVITPSTATGSRFRIIAYDMEEHYKYMVIDPITVPMNPEGIILSYQFEINEIVKIRFSYRTILTLLGIEKL